MICHWGYKFQRIKTLANLWDDVTGFIGDLFLWFACWWCDRFYILLIYFISQLCSRVIFTVSAATLCLAVNHWELVPKWQNPECIALSMSVHHLTILHLPSFRYSFFLHHPRVPSMVCKVMFVNDPHFCSGRQSSLPKNNYYLSLLMDLHSGIIFQQYSAFID